MFFILHFICAFGIFVVTSVLPTNKQGPTEVSSYLAKIARTIITHICANNKAFPLKNQINSFFIVKSLYIPNICSNFAGDYYFEVMKKKFLNGINIMLGAMSIGLAGCHVSKQAASVSESSMGPKKYGPPSDVVRPMYGVPVTEPLSQDTVSTPAPSPQPVPVPDEPVVCKYGVPGGNW